MTAPNTAAPIDLEALAAPLPDLKVVAGEAYPGPDSTPQQRVAYVKKLLTDTNPIALTLGRQAARNTLYANNKTWLGWNQRRREWTELPLEEGEVRASMNHIRPILRSRTQQLLSAPIDFTLIPESNALEARDRATLGTNLLQSRLRLLNIDQKLDQALEYAYCGGVVALKSFWNPAIGPLQDAYMGVPEMVTNPETGLPEIGPDNQPLMQPVERPVVVEDGTGVIRPANEDESASQYRLGDTDVTLRTVFNIRLNPDAKGWSSAEGLRYLLDVEEVPLEVARRKFPDLAALLTASGGSNQLRNTENMANTALVRNPNVDPTQGLINTTPRQNSNEATTMMVEYWELPSPYYPKGRMIQIVGDQEAYDGPFPDGFFPYAPLFDEPAAGWPYGRPCVNDMISPTDVINRQWTAIDQEMYESGIGQFVSWDVPGMANQLGRTPRQIVKVPMRAQLQGRSIHDVFKRMEHANVPPDRWRMIEKAEQTLRDVGAFHEISRGQTPPGVDSGVAIQQLREQEAGQLQKAIRSLKTTLITVGRHQLSLARKYYETRRWFPVDRPDLGFMPESAEGVDLPDPETCLIELDNFKPRSDEAFGGQVRELMKDGVIPPNEGLRMLDLGRGVRGLYESQNRQYAKARQENLWMERGEAEFAQVGEEPAMSTIVDPLTGESREEDTGVMMPVMRVCHVTPPASEEPNPDGSVPQPQYEPFLLTTVDEHELHMRIHTEIVLDMSKPAELRQLALAHWQEHFQEVQRLQAAQPQPVA